MARFVVDAVTLLRLVEREQAPAPGHLLVAPGSIRTQVLDLLLPEVRQGRRSEPSALQIHDRITRMKLRLLDDRVSRRLAWRLAREHSWATLRDAEYLAITRLQADALVTIDEALAAKAENVVPCASLALLLAPPSQS